MKVLLATDGYPAARRAEDVLAKVADPKRIEVEVVSVPILGLPGPFDLAGPELRREAAADIGKAAVERLDERGFRAAPVDGEGRPGPVICEVATTGGHALVVLGAGGTSWLGNLLLGSVSTYVLHHAPCSVLIVHEAAAEGDPTVIVLGTDGSPGARAAEDALVGLVDPVRSEVVVVAIAPPSTALLSGPGTRGSNESEVTMSDALLERARRVAEEAAERLREAGLAASIVARSGSATALLLEESHERKSDLVVVGARGIGGERLPFLGSVSDQIARHAPAALIAR